MFTQLTGSEYDSQNSDENETKGMFDFKNCFLFYVFKNKKFCLDNYFCNQFLKNYFLKSVFKNKKKLNFKFLNFIFYSYFLK